VNMNAMRDRRNPKPSPPPPSSPGGDSRGFSSKSGVGLMVMVVAFCVVCGVMVLSPAANGLRASITTGQLFTKIYDSRVQSRTTQTNAKVDATADIGRRSALKGVSATAVSLIATSSKVQALDTQSPFKVSMDLALDATTTSPVTFEIYPEWAPLGAEQFKTLVSNGFYNDCRFFRVVDNFVVQFGINGSPDINKQYKKPIKDDPVTQSNKRGTIVFATSGKNSRTTQLFVNLQDNAFLDRMGFSPIGKVSEGGMEIIDKIYGGYGEGAPSGSGPDQMVLQRKGNSYLESAFPKLSYIKAANVITE